MSPTVKFEEKMRKILEEGINLLWSNGYHATSVNDIVKAAGIPKGSFYHYFDSKEDFVIKALEIYFERQFGPVKEIIKAPGISPRQRLLNFYQNRLDVMKREMNCTKGCMASNLASEVAEHSESVRTTLLLHHKTIIDLISEVIAEAQSEGEVNNTINARDLAEFIEDAGKGAMTSMKEMNDAYPLDNHFQMVKNHLLI